MIDDYAKAMELMEETTRKANNILIQGNGPIRHFFR